jgi:hypothetical protein
MFLRRWSLDSPGGPVPFETAPVELDIGHGHEGVVLLPSPEPDRLAILTLAGDELEVRSFPFTGEVPVEPDGPSSSIALGGRMADAATDPERGVLVLLVIPVSGTPDCVTGLVALDPRWEWRPAELATWGTGGGLGCDARLALVSRDRYAVAWKTPDGTGDGFVIHWTIGALETGF